MNSRSQANWQTSCFIIEEAGGRKGRAIHIYLIRSPVREKIPSPSSLQKIAVWFLRGNFDQEHLV